MDESTYSLIDVGADSIEFKEVYSDFKLKFQYPGLLTFKVQRIQNFHLYQNYFLQKQHLSKKVQDGNEMVLFHGTKSDVVNGICNIGFDRSHAGENGLILGPHFFFEKSN